MSNQADESETNGTGPSRVGAVNTDKVQCPNCCRLAPVTSRSMGLLFYACELCGTMGAAPGQVGDPETSIPEL